jgi:hypothetical protein
MNIRYCGGCDYDGPHCHCGDCESVCTRSANTWSVQYACPSCKAQDITIPECDAYERAAVDSDLRIPERYIHNHFRIDGREV